MFDDVVMIMCLLENKLYILLMKKIDFFKLI